MFVDSIELLLITGIIELPLVTGIIELPLNTCIVELPLIKWTMVLLNYL